MTKHAETRILPYTARQMYDLVADVARYPEFLPWTAAARIRSVTHKDDHDEILADLVVSFKVFRERFGSKVWLYEQQGRIDTAYVDGPFKHLESRWIFQNHPDGSEVSFSVDFEFRNRILQGAAGMFFTEAMQRIVGAFETRARTLYGAPNV